MPKASYHRTLIAAFGLVLLGICARSEPLTCAGCGGPISGEYIVVNNTSYHAGHFTCDECGQPITGPFTTFDGMNLHDACYRSAHAILCDLCNQPISGGYLSSYWGEKIHDSHRDIVRQCEYCSRIIGETTTGGARIYNDGRNVCEICAKFAVLEIEDAEALMDSVRAELSEFGIVIDGDTELKFGDRDDLSDFATASGQEALGVAELKERSSFFGLIESKEIVVHVLNGVPRPVLRSVMAHELMHVWQYRNAPENNSVVLNEGSCEFASELILRNRPDDPYTSYMLHTKLQSKDSVYGEGYRKVREYVADVGLERWLKYLNENSEPPWQN